MKSNGELIIEETEENKESKEVIDTYFEGDLAKEDEEGNDEGIEPFPFEDLVKEAIQNEREQYWESYQSY